MRLLSAAALVVLPLSITACSINSLSGSVQSSSLDYATVFEQYNNQSIIRNIIRASDGAPLNFADLPILHGSLNFSAGAGVTAPFGPLHAGNTRDGLSANFSFGSSPTFDTNPLNTSGFSLLTIQPISPTFVVAAWQAGLPKELLLRLFVESIEFTKCGQRVRIDNDPEDRDITAALPTCHSASETASTEVSHQAATFNDLIEAALFGGLDLRLFTFYLPLGKEKSVTAIKDIVDASAAADAANLHVGNASSGNLEVFRVAAGQALGCLDVAKFNSHSSSDLQLVDTLINQEQANMPIAPRTRRVVRHVVRRVPASPPPPADHTVPNPPAMGRQPPPDASSPGALGERLSALVQSNRINALLSTGSVGVGGTAQQGSAAATSGGAGATKSPTSTGSAPTSKTTPAQSQQSEVQPGQISTVVGNGSCLHNPILLKQTTELEASNASDQGVVIHWRSIASIFHYLGVIVATQHGVAAADLRLKKQWSWNPQGLPMTGSAPQPTANDPREILFDLTDDPALVRVSADYLDRSYGVPRTVYGNTKDDSLIVMSLLTQLLNDSRIAGDIPTTQRLEVVP